MTKEVEAKILEVSQEKLEETLRNLGARKVFDGKIRTLLFDFGDGRISGAKDTLRLRQAGVKVELTYKKVLGTQVAKTAEEYSVIVSDGELMKKILENLGLEVTLSMEKHRSSYKIGNVRLDFDRYLGSFTFIPEFLEIEAENIQLIHQYASKLGFKPKDCLPWSTEELIQHYKGIKTENT